MRRVVLDAPELAGLPLRPAMDLGLMLTAPDYSGAVRPVRRRYTIVGADPQRGTVAVDGILHGHGPGARWFAEVHPGATIEAVGPRAGVEPADADWHLLVGDESALPAFAEVLGVLPPGVPAVALVEVTGADDEVAVPSRAALDLRWIHRRTEAPGGVRLLAGAVSALSGSVPAGRGHAYLLGESRAVVALRPGVAELGLDPDAVYVKGYWNAVPLRAGGRPVLSDGAL